VHGFHFRARVLCPMHSRAARFDLPGALQFDQHQFLER